MTINILKNPTPKDIDLYKAFHRANRDKVFDNSRNIFDTPRIISTINYKGMIVSGLVIYFKTIVFEERIIQIGAIGDVVTAKEFRNRGYASLNISRIMEELAKFNIELAILATDIELLGSFYEKFGFVPLSKPYFFVDNDAKIQKVTVGMIANINNRDSFDYLLNTSERIFLGISNF